jgi:hypothetical protein
MHWQLLPTGTPFSANCCFLLTSQLTTYEGIMAVMVFQPLSIPILRLGARLQRQSTFVPSLDQRLLGPNSCISGLNLCTRDKQLINCQLQVDGRLLAQHRRGARSCLNPGYRKTINLKSFKLLPLVGRFAYNVPDTTATLLGISNLFAQPSELKMSQTKLRE